ncbi:MAG: hypothetical protein ACRDH2_02715 [Anaerolineales bacterium]
MDLGQCPYCKTCGLVTTMRSTPAGFEVSGRCTVCGYTCDSKYSAADTSDDLPFEFSQPVETHGVD